MAQYLLNSSWKKEKSNRFTYDPLQHIHSFCFHTIKDMCAPPFLLYVLVKKHGFLYASSSFLAKSSFWNEVAEKAVTWGRYVFYFLLALHCFLRHCLIQWLQSVSCTQRLQLFQPIALILFFFFLQTVPKRQSGQSLFHEKFIGYAQREHHWRGARALLGQGPGITLLALRWREPVR